MPLRRREAHANDPPSDEDLVLLAQQGQRAAFGLLYDRYLPRVYGYCYRVLGSHEAAEDANMDVFLRALAALPTYRAGSFRSWLFTIAHNVITDALRRRRPLMPLEAAAHVSDPATFEEAAEAAADWERVDLLLPHLTDDQRHVIALRLAGLSATEIGEALGKPRNAIDGLHHRALLRLRALVAMSAPVASNEKGGG